MKKKLYGSVLLVGGGLAVPGAAAALTSRLEMRVPQGSGSTVEVFTNPRVMKSTEVQTLSTLYRNVEPIHKCGTTTIAGLDHA